MLLLCGIAFGCGGGLKSHFGDVSKDDAKTKGGAVLLHCQSGVSRSATATIAYLMHNKGLAATKAYELVKQKRSCINPNLGFIRQLQDYEDTLKADGILPTTSSNTAAPSSSAEPTPFLVHYLRSAIPTFTQNISDDQLVTTAKRCDYNYIQVLASLRAQATQQPAC